MFILIQYNKAVHVTFTVRKTRCGHCKACKRQDCGLCKFCLDKKKFGGQGRLKQCCLQKKCEKLSGVSSKPHNEAGMVTKTYPGSSSEVKQDIVSKEAIIKNHRVLKHL